jgi:hypothetical protein
MSRLTRLDWLALFLSLLAVAASGWVAAHIFEGVPHIEDDFAYTWQAEAIASGQLKVPSPLKPSSFLIPFVVDYQGWRFGKYPIGWPALLAVGVRLGGRAWVNPILAGLGIWFTYRLGKRVANPKVGLLAAFLTLTSPFFLMNSGSLLAHPLGLVGSAVFALGWIEAFASPEIARRWLPAIAAALALGLLAITRPFTALAVAAPFFLHGLVLLWKGDRPTRLRLLMFGALALACSLVHLLWQFAATGDPLRNTYTLWWPYDKIGFGPGIGATLTGHNLQKALLNVQVSLFAGASDTFGWPFISYLLLPFGAWALRRNLKAWLAGSAFFALVGAYLAYWVGSRLYGPRYYYEGFFSLAILSAAGAAWLGGWATNGLKNLQASPRWPKIRRYAVVAGLAALVTFNLCFYLPFRMASMYRLFGIGSVELAVFYAAASDQAQTPALVFVESERWMHYAIYTELQNPDLTSPFIFAWSVGPQTDREAAENFPQRNVYYYNPEEPGVLSAPPWSSNGLLKKRAPGQ